MMICVALPVHTTSQAHSEARGIKTYCGRAPLDDARHAILVSRLPVLDPPLIKAERLAPSRPSENAMT
jgi:hypothetical protein